MAKAEEILEGMELPEDTKAKIVEKLNPVLLNYETSLGEERSKLKEAVESRQKTKDELKELKAKFVEGDFDGKRELELRIKEKELELATNSEKTKNLEAELLRKSQELEAIESETRETLKERFPEGKWEVVKDLPISKVRELAKLEVEFNPNPAHKGIKLYKPSKTELTSEEKIATLYKK